MKDLMLDLETMDTGPNAAIIAIGAVGFDLDEGKIGTKFYQVVDLASAVKGGGVIDPSTVLWWMQQSDEARRQFTRGGVPLEEAPTSFSEWIKHALQPDVRVWGNGAAFDNVILRSAYERAGMTAPWSHWADRCYRTVKSQYPGVKIERVGTYHNAVDDAESQARHLIAMLNMWHDAALEKPPVDEDFESDILLCSQHGSRWPFIGWYNAEYDKWHVAHYSCNANVHPSVTHWRPLTKNDLQRSD